MPPRPATPQTARAINDRAALSLFASRGALTAAQLQEATGLARPTVTELLGRLGDAGLVEQIGEVGINRRGPNARLYALAGHRACVVGVDVRADLVFLTVTDVAGRTLAERAAPIPRGTAIPSALDTVTTVLAEAVKAHGAGPLHSVTIGVPGLVNPVTGRVQPAAAHAGWHADLAEAVRVRTGLGPGFVTLENEVNLAGIAEHRAIGPRGTDTFGLLWLGGTGVGASLILDGVLRRGASGGAGELGFLRVPGVPGGPDRPGLNQLIGPRAVAGLAAAHGVAASDYGHEAYRTELADRIALGVAAFALVVDPGVVVLGGDLIRAGGAVLAAAVEQRLGAVCPVPTRVRPTAVPGNPILAGAVATALDCARAALWP